MRRKHSEPDARPVLTLTYQEIGTLLELAASTAVQLVSDPHDRTYAVELDSDFAPLILRARRFQETLPPSGNFLVRVVR